MLIDADFRRPSQHRLFGKIAPIEEYYDDLEKGTLPSVVYIAPGTASEHPPGTPAAGQRFVRRFKAMEAIAAQRGIDLGRLDEAALEALWAESA